MIALVIAAELFGPDPVPPFRVSALLDAWIDAVGWEKWCTQ